MARTPEQDKAVQALLERARRTNARKQHLVPKFYLKQWANEKGLVRVTDKVAKVDYLKKPENVSRITDFYTLQNEQLDPSVIPPLLAETIFAEAESQTAPIIRRLSTEERTQLAPDEIVAVTLFLALQLSRGRRQREQHAQTATNVFRLQFSEMTDAMLSRYLDDENDKEALREAREAINDVLDGKYVIAPDQAGSIAMAFGMVEDVARYLATRAWVSVASPTPLITSDEPVVTLGAENRPRGERSGIATSRFIVFPIHPYRVLMMLRPDLAAVQGFPTLIKTGAIGFSHLDMVEAMQINKELVMNCHRWSFEHPETRIGANMPIPTGEPEMGQEMITMTDARGETAEVQRSFPTTRWASLPPSVWPQGHFWPESHYPYPISRPYAYRGTFDNEKEEFMRTTRGGRRR